VALVALVSLGCGRHLLSLNAPNIAPSDARNPTHVDVEPFVVRSPERAAPFAAPGPAAVLAAGIRAELDGRALRAGPAEGYTVRCSLDRFAIRSRQSVLDGEELVLVYADLSCEAGRRGTLAAAWRGEIRGRSAATAPNLLGNDANTTQRLVDRALSDVSREMASDLALRALALAGDPSARVFADESQQHSAAGLDDEVYGPAALQENPKGAAPALRALGERDAATRAAAWNVVAMASGTDDAWLGGSSMKLDEDPIVRFVQYKALGRLGGASALEQLTRASGTEGDPLLAEFLRDTIATGGIGMARSPACP